MTGAFTHFATADEETENTNAQYERFVAATDALKVKNEEPQSKKTDYIKWIKRACVLMLALILILLIVIIISKIDQWLKEKETKAIVGKISIDEFFSELKVIKKNGLDQMTKEMQEYWKKLNS